jgi:DNA modification methylase
MPEKRKQKPQVKTDTVALSSIHLNDGTHGLPKNPRFIRDERFKALVKSIKENPEYMPARPIILDEAGTILGGNMRYRACMELGMKTVPASWVQVVTGWSVAKKRRFIILDNRPFGEDDFELLGNEWDIKDLIDAGFEEEDLTGIIPDNAPDAPVQIDRAAELNNEWKVKTGDLWMIGEHRLLCGDSTKKEEVDRVMGKEKATLVFTDPPYGVSIGKKNRMLDSFNPAKRCVANMALDDLKPPELKVVLVAVFTAWKPYFADDCSIFICSPQEGDLMMTMMQEAGIKIRHTLNWVKNKATFSMGRLDYDYQHEPILFTWMKTHKCKKMGPFQTSVWAVNKPSANKEHPTMKPIELPSNAILNHTDKNDIVVDMFLGSGTTMVACQNTNRRCRGVEIAPGYCAVILQRMSDAFPGIKIARI